MKTLADIFALMDTHDELYIPESHMPTVEDLNDAEKCLGVTFGPQLKELLLSKMYSVGSSAIWICKQIAEETKRQWEYNPITNGYGFFLSYDEWDMCVDSKDNVYLVDLGRRKIEPQNKKLFDWIYDTAEDWYSY